MLDGFHPPRNSREPYSRHAPTCFAANATTELAPTPFFPKLVKQATDYEPIAAGSQAHLPGKLRLHHRLTAFDEQTSRAFLLMPEAAPFERRVMERFARGVDAVIRAAAQDDTKLIIENVSTGFSANACEQFAKLIEDTSPGGMRIAFAFSPEWQLSPGITTTPDYEVGLKHIEVTRAAAKVLRERPAPRTDTVTGLIFDLHSRNDPLGLFGGFRADQTSCCHGGRRAFLARYEVIVRLTQDDYEKAVEAHRQGIPVTVNGVLEQRGARSWELSNITSFVVEDATAPP